MPKKHKSLVVAGVTPALNVPPALLDQLVKGPMSQGNLDGMFRSLTKAVIERAMAAPPAARAAAGRRKIRRLDGDRA